MSSMFQGCSTLTNLDLSNFSTGNVETMTSMFSNCTDLSNLDISKFTTNSATDLAGMFNNCRNLRKLDLSKFNTSNVEDMSSMFDNCKSLQRVDMNNLKLKDVDSLLPGQNKFFKQAQELNKEQDAINEINNAITQKYLDNARPLADKSSIRFENAINALQKRTGINFANDLKDIRAREALEKFFPGQGGGSGSSQGFGNLLRTALIGGSPTAAVLTGNPVALSGLLAVSPKIMAKGTIKNIGKLKDVSEKAVTGAYDEIINRLSNLGAKGISSLMYGNGQ